jgi:hypothetical protein
MFHNFVSSDLALTPDVYSPARNDAGEYEDSLRGYNFHSGLRCGCGAKTVFAKRANFMTHIQSKHHKEWIQEMNSNTSNYYTECMELKELVNNQKRIIARLETDNSALITKLAAKDVIIVNLATKIANSVDPGTELDVSN